MNAVILGAGEGKGFRRAAVGRAHASTDHAWIDLLEKLFHFQKTNKNGTRIIAFRDVITGEDV